jgi:hypothetical protein
MKEGTPIERSTPTAEGIEKKKTAEADVKGIPLA